MPRYDERLKQFDEFIRRNPELARDKEMVEASRQSLLQMSRAEFDRQVRDTGAKQAESTQCVALLGLGGLSGLVGFLVEMMWPLIIVGAIVILVALIRRSYQQHTERMERYNDLMDRYDSRRLL